jgi:hypothetical protein
MHKTKATTRGAAGHAGRRQANAGERRLHKCGDDHAERDAADRLRGEPHDALARFPRKAPAEAQQSIRRAIACRICDGGNREREQELHEQPAHALHRARDPKDGRSGVRRRRRRDVG